MLCLALLSLGLGAGAELSAQVTTPVDVQVSPPSLTDFSYSTNSDTNIVGSPFAIRVSSVAATGADSGGIYSFANGSFADISLQNLADSGDWSKVILVLSEGGAGDSIDGGSAGNVTATNSGYVLATGTFSTGLSLFAAQSVGGFGSNAGMRNGMAGGNAGNVSISNFNILQAAAPSSPIQGGTGFRGMQALSQGGDAGDDPAGDDGGNAGTVIATNSSGNIEAAWHATNSSGIVGVYGVSAESIGGAGGAAANVADNPGYDGGNGGNAMAAQVIHQSGSMVRLFGDLNTSTQLVTGAALVAQSLGGAGGNAYAGSTGDQSYAGTGGSAAVGGTTSVTVTDSSVEVVGDYLGGILAQNIGGKGGSGLPDQDHSISANGGSTGNISVSTTRDVSYSGPMHLVTDGVQALGIRAGNEGGDGGGPSEPSTLEPVTGGVGGSGGNGGATGTVEVTLGNGSLVTLSTEGEGSTGIFAYNSGGNGGIGIGVSAIGTSGTPGNGGAGGQANDVAVTLGSVELETFGANSYGMVAQASAGNGADGGEFKGLGGIFQDVYAGSGGAGGSTGNVSVTTAGTTSISTHGDNSSAIVAMNLSGNGGAGGAGIEGPGDGPAGNGGSVGQTSVENYGSIHTEGVSSSGILALASSGGGGASGLTSDIFHSTTRNGGAAGNVGTMILENYGSVVTLGDSSHGILGISVGGGGGAAGNASGITALGGQGGPSADGGVVYFENHGDIETHGQFAPGILLQSIGGGGGDGGSGSGILYVGGGSGSSGGSGAAVGGVHTGSVHTTAENSTAMLFQSIGGGGGNAGNATANSVGVGLSVGGTGGGGGSGGLVTPTVSGEITTEGNASRGVQAQSIGGGGGNGGAAYALVLGLDVGAAASIGGNGAVGGNGGTVSIDVDGAQIWTGKFDSTNPPAQSNLPSDAIGVLAQSIGGGGGSGGSSFASALAIGIPQPPNGEFSAAIAYSVGGDGGAAGDASGYLANPETSTSGTFVGLHDGTQLTTQGQGSHGVLAQGIGGGGGHGGDSTAMAATVQYTRVESFGNSKSSTMSTTLAVNLGGGAGGSGGNGGLVRVGLGDPESEDFSNVTTYGDYSNGLTAQSIGGGGGNAGLGSGSTAGFGASESVGVDVVLGSQGGTGGDAWQAEAGVGLGSEVNTYGSGSHGVVVQSIGGGGGTSQGGMLSMSGSYTLQYTDDGDVSHFTSIQPTGELTLNLGTSGGGGGNGYNANARVDGSVSTVGDDSAGVLAQSIGGGGGIGGSGGADASSDNPVVAGLEGIRSIITQITEGYVEGTASATLNLGSSASGSSGQGGIVQIENNGTISTQGDWSQGILAQSIGGGGGKAGSALASGIPVSMEVDMTVGGRNGTSGDGSAVSVTMDGGTVSTGNSSGSGHGAYGILMQSIGGGGGLAVDGSDRTSGSVVVGGDNGNRSGTGGSVSFAGTGSVETAGDEAHGIVMQSIGGGGGLAGLGSSAGTAAGTTASVTIENLGNASGRAGTVEFESSVRVETKGDNAFGLLAQSIGGGGGLAAVLTPDASVRSGSTIEGSNGGEVILDLQSGSSITTHGVNAHGIVAQSIGGGGGIAGYSSQAGNYVTGSYQPVSLSYGNGSTIDAILNAGSSVITEGDGAFGMLLQSLGQGGGISIADGTTYLGSTGMTGAGSGGLIMAKIDGELVTRGENTVSLFAQSASGLGGGGGFLIDVSISGSVRAEGSASTAVQLSGGSIVNVLSVSTGASLIGPTAISQGAGGALTVANQGILSGSVVGSIDSIQNTGSFYTGETVAGSLTNVGSLIIGSYGGAPGNNETSSTHFTGSVNFTGGSASFFVASETEYDSMTVDGVLDLGSALTVFEVDFASLMSAETQLTLFTYYSQLDGGGQFEIHLTGAYEGILNWGNDFIAQINGQEVSWVFSEEGEDDSQNGRLHFQGQAVPEPSTVVLLVLGGTALAYGWRRRKGLL